MNEKRVTELYRELLIEMGEDPDREGLIKTPERAMNAMKFLTKGYRSSSEEVINEAIFTSEANNMIIARDIEVFSMCEHHMLPFFGRCHIGYIPTGKILGVSKLARLVEVYARRLQIQERLTSQVARDIFDTIAPEGVGVVIEARHLCMMMRGVEKQNSIMTTSSVLGTFLSENSTRAEFLSLISRPC